MGMRKMQSRRFHHRLKDWQGQRRYRSSWSRCEERVWWVIWEIQVKLNAFLHTEL